MPVESKSQKAVRSLEINRLLHRYYPGAECALIHRNPFELLIATILSAQCTDARVNQVTPALFAQYPTPEAMAQAPLQDIEDLIRPTGFFRAKAQSLVGASKDIVAHHGGKIPQEMPALTKLRGVGRKTANVVLGVAFKTAEGLVVDTHVRRLSQRLGLTKNDNPVAIEKDLCELIPRQDWIEFSHCLILHGRQICKARKPTCEKCFLSEVCPTGQKVLAKGSPKKGFPK